MFLLRSALSAKSFMNSGALLLLRRELSAIQASRPAPTRCCWNFGSVKGLNTRSMSSLAYLRMRSTSSLMFALASSAASKA